MPSAENARNMAIMKPQSPTRLVTNAFLPAVAALSRVCQNAIRKYEQVPTPSHPRNVTSRFDPSTSISMLKANRLRYRKNLENFGSPCMYPIEYRWISAPTPVTNRHIVMLSGSTRNARSTCSVPTGIQVKSLTTWARSSPSFDSRSRNTPTVTRNDAPIIVVAR